MNRTGIMGALSEEVELFVSILADKSVHHFSGITFFSGILASQPVVVVQSGAGKVNAAMSAQLLISHFGVERIIFTGVAGALDPELNPLDVVIGSDSVQHDMDAVHLGFALGQVPFTEYRFFSGSTALRGLAIAAAQKKGLSFREGRILTGDQFIQSPEKSAQLRTLFEGVCVDMESAAVAQVCHLNHVPHLIIRSISDRADSSAHVDFAQFVRAASRNSFALVHELLRELILPPVHSLKSSVRTVPHWPRTGIMFRDITTLLKDRSAFNAAMDLLVARYAGQGIDAVAGIEARGFIVGAVLAHRLGVGFVPVRKKGKLPAETVFEEYALEYGTDRVEIHTDAVSEGMRVLVADDLLATGGTASAACRLVSRLGEWYWSVRS